MKNCGYCRKKFQPPRGSRKKFCSDRCRREAWNAARRDRRGTPEPLRESPLPPSSTADTDTASSWRDWVIATYPLDRTERRLLDLAVEAWGRYRQAKAVLDSQGLTFVQLGGKVTARPEVQIEKDSRSAFQRLVRDLNLESAGEPVGD